MARKSKSNIHEGDEVLVKGRVTYIYDDALGPLYVVDIHGALETTKARLREVDIEKAADE